MELLDRYLQAVRFFLPRHQQDDIVRELSENLVSQIEDRGEELGRDLTEAEIADILRRHGHPLLVAGRYRTRQHLIGPGFFPIYLAALWAGLTVALVVLAIETIVRVAMHGDPIQQLVRAMLEFPGRGLMVFACVTLVFAALDFAKARIGPGAGWDPRSLPRVVKREYHLSRAHTAFEAVMGWAGVVWLLLIPRYPHLVLGPAADIVTAGAVWRTAYVPILIVMVATALLHVANLVRPYWTKTRGVARLATHAVSLAVLLFLLGAGEYFVPAATTRADAARIADIVNMGFRVGIVVAALITLLEAGKEVYRLRTRRPPVLPHDSTATV